MKKMILFTSLFSLATFFSTAATRPATYVDSIKTNQESVKKDSAAGVKSKKNVRNKEYVVRSQSYLNDIANLEEGYTATEGGRYAIKDYLIKGEVNLISITYGVALASGNYNSGEISKRYYILRNTYQDSYKEVFLTKKSGTVPTMSKVLLGTTQTYRGMLNTKKSTGGMVEVTKAILSEMMADDADVLEKISKITKVTIGAIKSVVKLYNSKH